VKANIFQETTKTLGAHIGLLRRQRGLSAAELARLAGLSKATLSALELGKGYPTVETLYGIAAALRIPVTDLLTVQVVLEPTIHRREKQDPSEPYQKLLQRFDSGQAVEIWNLRLPPKGELDGIPHVPGTTEYVLVNNGSLYAGPVTNPQLVMAGDFLSFPAEGAHRYIAENEMVDATVIMASSHSFVSVGAP
jgi:transcriptional regulator with XRE-family HTH domain